MKLDIFLFSPPSSLKLFDVIKYYLQLFTLLNFYLAFKSSLPIESLCYLVSVKSEVFVSMPTASIHFNSYIHMCDPTDLKEYKDWSITTKMAYRLLKMFRNFSYEKPPFISSPDRLEN
jgi:hypothetical protein